MPLDDFGDVLAREAMGLPQRADPWPPGDWPEGQGLAGRLAALDAALLRCDSATAALERWCREHGPASPGGVRVQVERDTAVAPAPGLQAMLQVSDAEPVHHRRVRLIFARVVLSEADNWYVPGRLTPAMGRRLHRSDMPFGRVVRALRFRRVRLAAEVLWAPPASSGAPDRASSLPAHVLRHRALLLRADGAPFSHVAETYTRDALFLPGGAWRCEPWAARP